MRNLNVILSVIGAFSLCSNVAAQDQDPLPVLEALPPSELLGPNWSREISLLFDPASDPSEIVIASAKLPETFRKERLEAVENPKNRISGSCHAHYDFQGKTGNQRYEIQVNRYRSKKIVEADFAKLLALGTKQYQKAEIYGIGEAAVIYSHSGGMTLWFRRETFYIWISPLAGSRRWEDDSALQHLAKAFDARLDEKLGDKTTATVPK